MNKSVFERFFPHSPKSELPQYENHPLQASRRAHTPPAIALKQSSHRSASRSTSTSLSRQTLNRPPLSASLIHHDDPFLPIDRAAKALQATLQSLLDDQSRALGGRASLKPDDVLSNGSLTPTQTATSEARSSSYPRTMPIRQPPKEKVTLRATRRGLKKGMSDFAALRMEELRLLSSESKARVDALERVQALKDKEEALTSQIDTIKTEESTSAAESLRREAQDVQNEIRELEHRLLELKVKHRHLLSQADQIENTFESKVSSYQSTLGMVRREAKSFLKRPPIQQPFAGSPDEGMYALTADRRTLQMAAEQWTAEQEAITRRTEEVEVERKALVEGQTLWSNAVERIIQFERRLRSYTRLFSQSTNPPTADSGDISIAGILHDLDALIKSLEEDVSHAQQQGWNLLVCAFQAELHASLEAREMLEPGNEDPKGSSVVAAEIEVDLLNDVGMTVADTSVPRPAVQSPAGSDKSNQSLQDTLAEFAKSNMSTSGDVGSGPQRVTHRYESEDDEPPADFLLSR